MPRDRMRDFRKAERLHNESRLQGSPGVAGRARVGGAGSGGGVAATQQGRGGGGTVIHHITLGANEGQTIAAGGGTVQWGTVASAPTEVRGFPSALQELADSGSVGAIPVSLTGQMVLDLQLYFSAEVTGTVTLRRTRGAITADIDSQSGTGDVFTWSPHLDVRAGDTITVVLDHSTTGTTYNSSSVTYSSSTTSYSSGGAFLDFGRLQATVWNVASPTSRLGLLDTVTMDTLLHTSDQSTYAESTITLADGASYELRVTGNYTNYATDDLTDNFGAPDAIMDPSPSGGAQTLAMHDADTIYADSTDSGDLPRHAGSFQIALDGSTWSHPEPDGGPFATPDGGHRYTYAVVGEGATLRIRIVDTVGTDNNGRLRVDIFGTVA